MKISWLCGTGRAVGDTTTPPTSRGLAPFLGTLKRVAFSAYPPGPCSATQLDFQGCRLTEIACVQPDGSYPHNPPVLVPGLEHALVYNFAGDNGGPQTVKAYGSLWAALQKEFPNAEIVASTFDSYTDVLQTTRATLPKLSKEIGDTWVYGVPSDPQKQARVRVINRAFSAAIGKLGGAKNLHTDKVLQNATRFALKLGEHTDGRDVKSNLVDNYSWKKADFDRAKAVGSKNHSQYAILEESWWEQRQWGVTIAIDTLANANHPLAAVLKAAVADLQPKVPSRSASEGFKPAKPGQTFKCGGVSIGFDETGAISHLVGSDGHVWADATHTLAQLKYLLRGIYTS